MSETDQANMNAFYQIALSMIPGVGPKTAKRILEFLPNPEALFSETKKGLEALLGKRDTIISAILSKSMFSAVEKELHFIEKNHIQVLFYNEEQFPQRLKRSECSDTPIVLYYKGNANLNTSKIVSIVGTRNATEYGKTMIENLLKGISEEQILIVSGLAYGIDTCSHKVALQNNLPTVGVLGHGLGMIYPSENRNLAKDMLSHGGLLTEYVSETSIEPGNFPSRNRIIAALADATIIIEAAKRGGALITAEIANGYNRDVFALPGRTNDRFSEGCNHLIKTNKAHLIQNSDDLFYIMGWKKKKNQKVIQKELFEELLPTERIIYDRILLGKELTIDEISANCDLSLPKIVVALLSLELKNIIKCLPGKKYKVI